MICSYDIGSKNTYVTHNFTPGTFNIELFLYFLLHALHNLKYIWICRRLQITGWGD